MSRASITTQPSPTPTRFLEQLFAGDNTVQSQAVDVLTQGLAVLTKASEASLWIDGQGKWRPGVQRNPELDSQRLFQLTNVRRAFLEILDAIEAGKKLDESAAWEAGKSLGGIGALDYRKLSALPADDPLLASLYQVDAGKERQAAILKEALGMLNVAAREARTTEAELLRTPQVRARFLELLTEIPSSPFFGKVFDSQAKEFGQWCDWMFKEARTLVKAARTVPET